MFPGFIITLFNFPDCHYNIHDYYILKNHETEIKINFKKSKINIPCLGTTPELYVMAAVLLKPAETFRMEQMEHKE